MTWEVKDDTGASLASGATWDSPEALSRKSQESQELDVVLYLLQPAKSEQGTLVLAASRLDVSSERMSLPVLSVPIRLDTATTELTILMPADSAAYEAEIDSYVDEPRAADFAPKTPLVAKKVTIRKLDEKSRMAATADALPRAMPAQGSPWQVRGLHLGQGIAQVDISSDAWTGVS